MEIIIKNYANNIMKIRFIKAWHIFNVGDTLEVQNQSPITIASKDLTKVWKTSTPKELFLMKYIEVI